MNNTEWREDWLPVGRRQNMICLHLFVCSWVLQTDTNKYRHTTIKLDTINGINENRAAESNNNATIKLKSNKAQTNPQYFLSFSGSSTEQNRAPQTTT